MVNQVSVLAARVLCHWLITDFYQKAPMDYCAVAFYCSVTTSY